MMDFLDTPIEHLSSISEKKANILKKEINVSTFADLLEHYPFRYLDKSKFTKIREIASEETYIQIVGKAIKKEILKGKGQRLVITLADSTGTIELVFFQGLKWISDSFVLGIDYVIFGKPTFFNGLFNFAHPEFETLASYKRTAIDTFFPIYSTTERMKNSFLTSKTLAKYTQEILSLAVNRIEENLPQYITKHYNLYTRERALREIHFPKNEENLAKAKIRLKFEELFFMQLENQVKKYNNKSANKGFVFSVVGDSFNNFYKNNLPFTLTNAQQRVVKEIRNDMRTGFQMNRLLQGDVGSGKTLVALLCMLIAIDNGFQASIIAPTEILAQQHYNSIKNFLKDMPLNVCLLTGSSKQKERKPLLNALAEGEVNILIGTHAILEDNVVFKNLGLAVIDEQHRFGVEQRAKMWSKNTTPPHVLVMTATPIPRTLAMSVYGDLECSVIDELPKGRKPIQTTHLFDRDILTLFNFMRKQIELGRQIYVVYPLIKESEKMDLKDLMDGYESIVREFPLPKYQISIVHGQMKAEDKDYEMQRFKEGITNIMVATTVIEVGVDVPNATVMVIENAERFGLAQLHQLRGRVGRGQEQSYCILRTKDDLSQEGLFRINTMCTTNNGFEIAQADLQLRGPGNIAGTQQSGVLELKIADIVQDELMMSQAKDVAAQIISHDPLLKAEENKPLRNYLARKHKTADFSQIS